MDVSLVLQVECAVLAICKIPVQGHTTRKKTWVYLVFFLTPKLWMVQRNPVNTKRMVESHPLIMGE